MSKLLDRALLSLKPNGGGAGKPDTVLMIRLAVAAVIFAVSLLVNTHTAVRIVLYAVALIIAGYDLLIDSINSAEGKDFFAPSILLCLAAIAAFFIGFAAEGTALILVYQIGRLVIRYVDDRSKKSIFDLLRDEDEETQLRIHALLSEKDAGALKLTEMVKSSAGLVLKILMVFALVFIFVLPFLGDFSYRVSIHRALMILILCTPMSLLVAMPLVGLTGMAFSAKNGVVFNRAETMETTCAANVAVFDKAGIFSQGEPRLLSVQSDVLDRRTFMNFVAHAAYYSEQPFAQAITAAFGSDYRLDVISDFQEIPGSGVELKIGGNPVLLANGPLFASRGIRIPQDAASEGQCYYLTIADRYIGFVVISNAVNEEARDLAEGIQEAGIRRCILVTEEGSEESQELGDYLGFHEIYGECGTEKKLQLLTDLTEDGKNQVVYIYANGFEGHSAANVDIRVSKKSKYADVQVQPESMMNLPFAVQICRRMIDVAKENAMLAFGVKAILVFLAMTGYCSLWFAVFADMVAAVATQLNSVRVTQGSILNALRNRR